MNADARSSGARGCAPGKGRCPYLKPTVADWLWPVEGICRGRRDDRLMVPPISHYLNLCTTSDHRLCEVFRARLRPSRLTLARG